LVDAAARSNVAAPEQSIKEKQLQSFSLHRLSGCCSTYTVGPNSINLQQQQQQMCAAASII
jgi:hypothetical protein